MREDIYFLKFFNIKDNEGVKLIMYNFQIGKFTINNVQDNLTQSDLSFLLENMYNLNWTTGYLLEDLINSFGLDLSRNTIIILFFLILTSFFMICLISICQLMNTEKLKRE